MKCIVLLLINFCQSQMSPNPIESVLSPVFKLLKEKQLILDDLDHHNQQTMSSQSLRLKGHRIGSLDFEIVDDQQESQKQDQTSNALTVSSTKDSITDQQYGSVKSFSPEQQNSQVKSFQPQQDKEIINSYQEKHIKKKKKIKFDQSSLEHEQFSEDQTTQSIEEQDDSNDSEEEDIINQNHMNKEKKKKDKDVNKYVNQTKDVKGGIEEANKQVNKNENVEGAEKDITKYVNKAKNVKEEESKAGKQQKLKIDKSQPQPADEQDIDIKKDKSKQVIIAKTKIDEKKLKNGSASKPSPKPSNITKQPLNPSKIDDDKIKGSNVKKPIKQEIESDEKNKRITDSPAKVIDFKVEEENLTQEQKEAINLKVTDPTEFYPVKRKPIVDADQKQKSNAEDTIFLDSSFESQPSFDHLFDSKELKDTTEYGYGTWLRYLSTYPEIHTMDPNQYYFISRLTQNPYYHDQLKFGDRTLSIMLIRNIFVFSTYDTQSDEKNLEQNIKINYDLEGKWHFIQYSYSSKTRRAQAYITRGTQESTLGLEIQCKHSPIFYLQLIVGGQHMYYNGFNGQFANLYYGTGKGLFISSIDVLLNHVIIKVAPSPQVLRQQVSKVLVIKPELFNANKEQHRELKIDDTENMPEEFSVSGWFRWIPDIVVTDITKFSIFNVRQNEYRDGNGYEPALGDRDLEAQFSYGAQEEGSIYFNTYTTSGNNGYGKPLISQIVSCHNHIWTFIYYGYSTKLQQAYGVLLQPALAKEITHQNIVHKLSPTLFFYVGNEPDQESFNGILAYFTIFLGPKSFRKGLIFEYTFNFDVGSMALFQLLKPIVITDDQKEQPRIISYDQITPFQLSIQHNDLTTKISGQGEYGFGMWTKWLRTEPKLLSVKKSQYMMGRVSTLKKYSDNDQMRDRTLALFLGEKAYQFITYNATTNTKNIMQQIDFTEQLEGQWNYLYFSYKRTVGKAIGHVIFPDKQSSTEIQCLHYLVVNYITFSLQNEFKIPLFNGLMTKIVFRVGPNSFIGDSDQIQRYIHDTLNLPVQLPLFDKKIEVLMENEIDLSLKQEIQELYDEVEVKQQLKSKNIVNPKQRKPEQEDLDVLQYQIYEDSYVDPQNQQLDDQNAQIDQENGQLNQEKDYYDQLAQDELQLIQIDVQQFSQKDIYDEQSDNLQDQQPDEQKDEYEKSYDDQRDEQQDYQQEQNSNQQQDFFFDNQESLNKQESNDYQQDDFQDQNQDEQFKRNQNTQEQNEQQYDDQQSQEDFQDQQDYQQIEQQNELDQQNKLPGSEEQIEDANIYNLEYTQYEGAQEYSLSGWVRFTNKEELTGQLHQIIKMSQRPTNQIIIGEQVGDETLSIIRLDGYYRFITYTCDNLGNKCQANQYVDKPYLNNWDQWSYIYFGYSRLKKKCFGYLKFTFSETLFEINPVNHFYLNKFSIKIGKDRQIQQYAQFLGLVKLWVLNIGKGAYLEENYKEDKNLLIQFGLFTKAQQEEEDLKKLEELEIAAGTQGPPLILELQEKQLLRSGIMEYGQNQNILISQKQ